MAGKRYNYIITGMGCAGLSLAVHLIKSGRFTNKKILLVDQEPKNKNDRTWCFWEKGAGLFEPVVHKQWNQLWFYGDDFYKDFSITPYHYKMIRGIDFYNYCLQEIKQHPFIEVVQEKVDRIFSGSETGIVMNGETILCDYIFNSILFEKPALTEKQHWLLQHFKGWQIELDEPTFDSSTATLMDFRISQEHGTAFCYVLPLTDRKALVEYTLFTPSLLAAAEYDRQLKNYFETFLHLTNYKITDTEFGVIPMTNYRFASHQNNISHIGTAGGQTKGSSGYTFYFIQKHSAAIVNSLIKTGKPPVKNTGSRFRFYDSVLLDIMAKETLPLKEIFSRLFQKNSVATVLDFLNNESSLAQEIKIFTTLPTLPFSKAAVRQLF